MEGEQLKRELGDKEGWELGDKGMGAGRQKGLELGDSGVGEI